MGACRFNRRSGTAKLPASLVAGSAGAEVEVLTAQAVGGGEASCPDPSAAAAGAAGAAALRQAGVPVTVKEYDMAHDSSEAEFADVLQVACFV